MNNIINEINNCNREEDIIDTLHRHFIDLINKYDFKSCEESLFIIQNSDILSTTPKVMVLVILYPIKHIIKNYSSYYRYVYDSVVPDEKDPRNLKYIESLYG